MFVDLSINLKYAKCFTNVYATCLLTLFVKVELNIIGAFLFLSNSVESVDELGASSLSSNVQQKFLENIENFVKTGLPRLMATIETYCLETLNK